MDIWSLKPNNIKVPQECVGNQISIYLISLIYFLIGMNPTIRYLNFLKRLTSIVLVMKSSIMSFVGHHYTFNYFLLIFSVIKKKKC